LTKKRDVTTIRLSTKMQEKLKSLKRYKRETYEEVIARLIAEAGLG